MTTSIGTRSSLVDDLQRRAEVELCLPSVLHQYQWEGIAFLHRKRSALLADEMGLGKTAQAAVALALLTKSNASMKRALIVAPSSLLTNWMAELRRWGSSLTVRRVQGNARAREAFYLLPIPVLVASYEQIREDGLDRIPSSCFDIVILDEAQRIKNAWSKTALACRLLPRRRAWALSATPLENSVGDVASILRFLEPARDPGGRPMGERLKSIMLRRRKRDVRRELPPVVMEDLRLELAPAQRERYDDLWFGRRTEVPLTHERDGRAAMLALITRLKLICNVDESSSSSSKLAALRTVCEAAGKEARILVFSQFVRTLEWIAGTVAFSHDLLTGAMSENERAAAIKRFRFEGTPRMLLVSLKAGGVGLNLGEATHVVMFDRWWNPAVEDQAIYRAHRFHRDAPLHVIRFLIEDTIEERIAHILDTKQTMFDSTIEMNRASGSGFTHRELLTILDLCSPTLPLET